MNRRRQSRKPDALLKCKVCSNAEAKYKCPVCRTPFCSVACSKEHKKTACEPYLERDPPSRGNRNRDSGQQRKVHPAAARRFENDVDPENDLTPAQYALLDGNAALQGKLRDSRLLEALREVDTSGDKRAALDAKMQDPEFLQFCDEVLACVGYESA